ncbi:MAG TPA: hypothetical protein VKP00_09535 [Gemmatimonadaceae bacterium]|nr:hypothetical protein [Gemmatimonadaceae bacterium]
MTSSLTLRRAAPLILLVVGCHDGIDAPSSPIDRARSLTATSLVDQTGVVGSAVASPPAVLVRDASGNPVAGVRVWFDGATTNSVLTGSDGIATIEWVLSARPGSYTVVAHTGKLNSVQFTASAVLGPPAYVSAMTPLDQAVVAGSSVPDTPAVIVTDYVSNPLPGIAVSFELGGPPGATIEHASVVTNELGIASPGAWTVGGDVGTYTLTARIDGAHDPATMSARVYEPFVVSTIAAGENATCANALSGATYCWGDNFTRPTRTQGDERFVSLTVGAGFACGLTVASAAYCWGRDVTSAADDPASAIFSVPHRVGTDMLFRLISAGRSMVCGLSMEGRAYCWGDNTYGQLGNGTTVKSTVPAPVAGGLTFVALSAGTDHACGVTTSGETLCWGRNDTRQLGDSSSTICDVVVEDDYYYGPEIIHTSCSPTPQRVSAVPALASVSASTEGTCGLSSGGEVFCWGRSHGAELVSSTLRFASIAATHDIAVHRPQPYTFVSSSMCGVTTSGALYCAGDSGLVAVAPGLSFSTVVAGPSHQCVVLRDSGAAYCWGENSAGELGNGTLTTANVPTPVVAP